MNGLQGFCLFALFSLYGINGYMLCNIGSAFARIVHLLSFEKATQKLKAENHSKNVCSGMYYYSRVSHMYMYSVFVDVFIIDTDV